MVKNLLLLTGLIVLSMRISSSQSVLMPNVALKSHETLDITKIMMSEQKTEIYLTVENRITGGTFCADRNIYIIYPDGTKSKLVSSEGIPVCPEVHKFKAPGEKLDFVLVFPPLKKGTEWFDLKEDCQENCFSFYGIILDNTLNRKIDDCFQLVENDEPAKAMVSFIKLAEETENKNTGAEGLLYMNIIELSRQSDNNVRAAEWYKRLESSGTRSAPLYIRHLNSLGIRY
jgi:hypothetical protein